jgi:hypothetical protein
MPRENCVAMFKTALKPKSSVPRPKAVPISIESRTLIVRQRVVLDTVLAQLYGVSVKRLNQQVHRNLQRFPQDFMFQLTKKEYKSLRLQIATSNKGRGGRRFLPYVFTEHGAAMAATVLNSKQAVDMSVFVVRAFVRMRSMLADAGKIASKITELEDRLETHDSAIWEILDAIKELMAPAPTSRRKIGFQLPSGKVRAGKQRSVSEKVPRVSLGTILLARKGV